MPRCACGEAPKNTVPASATVTIASAPYDNTWFQIRWLSPDSPAPLAVLAVITLRVTLRASWLLPPTMPRFG